jgi:putative flippase GtrA
MTRWDSLLHFGAKMEAIMSKKKKEIFRVIKFAFFSMTAGLIEFGSFALLETFSPFSYWPCYLIALILSIIWNFTLNRRYTFRSAANVPVAMLKVLAYYAVFVPVTTIGGNYLAETLHWNPYVVTLLNMSCNLITEFLFQRFVVFRKTLETNSLAARNRAKEEKESGLGS